MFKWLKTKKAAKREADIAYKKGVRDGYEEAKEYSTKEAFEAGYRRGKEDHNDNIRLAYDNEIRHLKWVIGKLESKPEGERDDDIAHQNVAKTDDGWMYGAWQKVSVENIQEAKDELLEALVNNIRELAQDDKFWIVKPVGGGQNTVAWKIAFPHMEPKKDYKQRMIQEYLELKNRYNKLHNMCIKYAAGTLDFTPTCSLELLTKQKAAMGEYLKCLEIRAEIEGVAL